MELFHLTQLRAAASYLEFLRKPGISVGVYRLEAGASDPQQPHEEDELYVVVAGRCRFCGGSRDVSVGPGDVIFVPAGEPHRFFDIAEAIEVVVVFSPAEGTRK